jgi:RNA polymerase sigma-70 factor (ECF subfamily)
MAHVSRADAAADFDPLRPTLIRVAYRMLGSVTDAEDVVQDAFLRWLNVDRSTVEEPAAFLRRIVTRLCLDRLKSIKRERAVYAGSWLPEPLVQSEDEEDVDEVTLPLMMALERLSPLERAAFLLYDVFDLSFEEVAATIGRDPAACRQLASRARAHIRADRPRYPLQKQRGLEIAEAFFAASRDGQMENLRTLLAADVTVFADGGGKATAHGAPVSGLDNVMRLFGMLASGFMKGGSRLVRYAFINGLPGFITIEQGNIRQTTALELADGRVVGVYVVRNPEKLKHVDDTVH